MEKPSAIAQRKILIVDDEYSIREALLMLFSSKGYSVQKAEDGVEALKLLDREDFDLIISDIRMKNMDGVALVRELKNKNKKIPVIFITAYPEVDNVIEALRCGVVEYIKKPFDMEYIAERAAWVINEKAKTTEEKYNKRFREEKVGFLNRLSHELRTPLTPVAGYLKLLLKKEFGELSPIQIQILTDMARNSERLKMTADDLLMLYELENNEGPLLLRKGSISKIISDTMSSLEAASKSKRLSVEVEVFDSIDCIHCDDKKIKRVFYHLVENAIKFSPEASMVKIMARKYADQGNDFIKFSIADAGKGVSGRDNRELFRSFYNVNPSGDDYEVNRQVRGLGIGLTLARAIVEAHCGRIWVEENSSPGPKETVFNFTLPAL
jgi:signal transduction histidine kinase